MSPILAYPSQSISIFYNYNICCPVVTPDEHYVVGVGYDAATNKEHLRVYHLRKGVFLHKIPLKYPNFKEIKVLVTN